MMADDWKTDDVKTLFEAILRLESGTRPNASSATCAR